MGGDSGEGDGAPWPWSRVLHVPGTPSPKSSPGFIQETLKLNDCKDILPTKGIYDRASDREAEGSKLHYLRIQH